MDSLLVIIKCYYNVEIKRKTELVGLYSKRKEYTSLKKYTIKRKNCNSGNMITANYWQD